MKEEIIHADILETTTEKGTVYCWRIANYSDLIASGLSKRTIEKASIRTKLKSLGFENELTYKENGQPFLNDQSTLFLSISHAKEVMALYLGTKAVGIDVEFERSKLFEGRSYFVNETEEKGELSSFTLQLIWGAKEAIYKQLEGDIEDLKNDVTLSEIDKKHGKLSLIYNNQPYEFRYTQFENYYLVFSS